MKRTFALAAFVLAGLSMVAGSAAANGFPDRPVKLIVPYPPGGGIVPTARMFAKALADELGGSLVVQNIGGASGQIGTEVAAKAPADGYTLLFASAAPNAILPAALPKLPYSNKDFVPITLIGGAAYVLVANPSVRADTIEELLATIRDQPDRIRNFASSGQLSGPHLAGELFKMLSKGRMEHVPYRGNGPAIAAVLGGEVPLTFASAPAVMPHVKDGRLKAYGISAAERAVTLPELPALGAAMPGLEVKQWYGLMAPAGTPPAIVDTLYRAAAKVLATASLQAQLSSHGVESAPMSPEVFGRFVESETVKYRDLIEKAGIPLQ